MMSGLKITTLIFIVILIIMNIIMNISNTTLFIN